MTELLGVEEGTMEIKDAGTLLTLVGRAWGVTDLVLKIKDRMHAERNEILGFTRIPGAHGLFRARLRAFGAPAGRACLTRSVVAPRSPVVRDDSEGPGRAVAMFSLRRAILLLLGFRLQGFRRLSRWRATMIARLRPSGPRCAH